MDKNYIKSFKILILLEYVIDLLYLNEITFQSY